MATGTVRSEALLSYPGSAVSAFLKRRVEVRARTGLAYDRLAPSVALHRRRLFALSTARLGRYLGTQRGRGV